MISSCSRVYIIKKTQETHGCKSLTFDTDAAGALGLLSSVIGQIDAEVGFISLLGVSDPQGEDVVSLDHQVLTALEHRLLVLQPLGLRSICVHLAVQDHFLSLFDLRVLQRRDDPQFLCRKKHQRFRASVEERSTFLFRPLVKLKYYT